MTAFELAGKLKLDSSEFTSSLNKQESAFKKFGNSIANTARKTAKLAGIAFASMTAGFVMFTKSSIREGMEFDETMSKVAATMGKTRAEVEDLADFARKMGATTAFSATEAAEALNYMALAGYDAQTSMAMLPVVLNLAAAGEIDLANASDMVTDASSALGLTVEETVALVDQMALASSKSNTSVAQLGEGILTVGGTAKMMAGGTVELTAALGILADNGIKGAEGGTALRNVLLSLTAPSAKAAKELKALGVDIFDAEGNMRELPDILDDMNVAMKDMSAEERTRILSTIFNKRDLKAIEALLGTDTARWNELTGAIEGSAGAAENMANTRLDNLAGDIKIFKSALSDVKLTLSNILTPALRDFVQTGTESIQEIGEAFKEGGFEAGFETIGKVIGEKIPKLFKKIAPQIKTAFTSIFRGVKTGVATLLGIEDTDDATWWDIISKAFSKITTYVDQLKGKVKVKLANILGLTDANGNPVDDPSDVSWGNIARKMLENLKTNLKNLKVTVANLLGLTDDNGNPIDDPSDITWGNIANSIFTNIKTALHNMKISIADLLDLKPENVGEEVSWGDIGKEIFEKIKSGISMGGEFLKELILGKDYVSGESDWKQVGNKILGWIQEAFKEGGLLSTLLTMGSDGLTEIARFAGELIKGIADWIAKPESIDTIVGIITTIVNALAQAAEPIVNALIGILTDPGLWTALGDMLKSIIKAIFGEDVVKFLFGDEARKESTDFFTEIMSASDPKKYIMDKFGDTPASRRLIKMYEDIYGKEVRGAGVSVEDWDNFRKAIEEARVQADNSVKSIDDLAKSAENAAGDYDLNFNINVNGKIPTEILRANSYHGAAELSDRSATGGGGIRDGKTSNYYHAAGEWNIPYDDYMARLHRGEMVLSSSQARKYRNNEGSIDYAVIGDMIGNAIGDAMSKVYVMLNGDKVGDLTTRRIKNNINALSYAKLRAMGG